MTSRIIYALALIGLALAYGLIGYFYKWFRVRREVHRLVNQFTGRVSLQDSISNLRRVRHLCLVYRLELPGKLTMDTLVQMAEDSCNRFIDAWHTTPEEKLRVREDLRRQILEFLPNDEEQIAAKIRQLVPAPATGPQ